MGTKFDLVVVGGGPGGYVAAIRAAQLGLRVALVERDALGGTCLNRGCIPTKTLLRSAEAYRQAQNGRELGIFAENVRLDLEQVYARKDGIVETMRNGIAALLKANGVEVYAGQGLILGAGRVQVHSAGETVLLEGENVLAAPGSQPVLPPIPGLDQAEAWTSDTVLTTVTPLPESLVILGGGVIGVELAAYFADLGCRVEILEALDRVLANLDRELSQSAVMNLKTAGVSVHTGARVERVERTADGVVCVYTEKGREQTASAAALLVAAGRKPALEGLFAEEAFPTLERGYVAVDESFHTSQPRLYAIGDAIGKVQLAHAASTQGIAVAESLAGKPVSVDLSLVPACVYTAPEIASVGLTEAAAKDAGVFVTTGKYLLTGHGKTLIGSGKRGFIKLVAEEGTGRLLGAQLLCDRATDLIGELALAVANRLTAADVAKTIHPHPTYCEGIAEAAEALLGHSVHTPPPRKPRSGSAGV